MPVFKKRQIAFYMVVCLPTRRAIFSRMLSCLFGEDVLQYPTLERAHLAKLNLGERFEDNHHEAEGNEITAVLFLLLFLADVSFTLVGGRGEEPTSAVISLDQIQFRRLMKKCIEVCRSRHSSSVNQSYDRVNQRLETAGLLLSEFSISWIVVCFSAVSLGCTLKQAGQGLDTISSIRCCTLSCHRVPGPSNVLCKSGPR